MVAPGYAEELRSLESYAKECLLLAAVQPSHEVLDVGTGPGPLAFLAAPQARQVTASDFSRGMIAEVHQRCERENVTAPSRPKKSGSVWSRVLKPACPSRSDLGSPTGVAGQDDRHLRLQVGVKFDGQAADHVQHAPYGLWFEGRVFEDHVLAARQAVPHFLRGSSWRALLAKGASVPSMPRYRSW